MCFFSPNLSQLTFKLFAVIRCFLPLKLCRASPDVGFSICLFANRNLRVYF